MSLEIRNLTKTFGEKTIFRDFFYIFQDTGSYVLKGDSGAGKTSLLRIISGLDTDYSGEIIDGGISKTSICFQEHRLFPQLSALANIIKLSFADASEENENKARDTLKRLGFSNEDMKLKPSKLSGGMKQRVAFARALLRNTPVLLLDEPTKEIDSDLSHEMIKMIKDEASRRLVITVTHRKDEWELLGNHFIEL